MKISGIYKITCTISNNFYIGSSCNIKSRWSGHRSDLRHNKHQSKQLQRAYTKYGLDCLNFEIIEECPRTQCITREQYYLDTLKPLYNSEKMAGAWAGKNQDIDHINKRVKNRTYPKEVICRRIKFECITLGICFTHYNDCLEFFKEKGIKISSGNLGSVLSGRRKHTMGLVFRKIENPKEFKPKKLKNRVRVINTVTKEIIISISELSRRLGLWSSNLAKMLNGDRNNNTDWILYTEPEEFNIVEETEFEED